MDCLGDVGMEDQKFVQFELNGEQFGLNIASVERIMAEVKATPMPRSPKILLGVFDLRGSTVPIVDLRRRFDFAERSDKGSFVVAHSSVGRFALRVDKVIGIVSIAEDKIEDQPEAWQNQEDPFIQSIAKTDSGLVALLDPENVIPKNVASKIAKLEKKAA
jgi:purine-binding chemotaxis protein CheW